MKRRTIKLKYQNIIQSIDYQTQSLELMLDELIFSFNSSKGPCSQLVIRSSFILSNIQLIQLYQTKINKNEKESCYKEKKEGIKGKLRS